MDMRVIGNIHHPRKYVRASMCTTCIPLIEILIHIAEINVMTMTMTCIKVHDTAPRYSSEE